MMGRAERAKAVLSINFRLLTACIAGFVAWALWPSTIEWWQFGLISIVCWCATAGALLIAFKEMLALHRKERVFTAFKAQGEAPKSAKLTSVEDLRKAGMIDG